MLSSLWWIAWDVIICYFLNGHFPNIDHCTPKNFIKGSLNITLPEAHASYQGLVILLGALKLEWLIRFSPVGITGSGLYFPQWFMSPQWIQLSQGELTLFMGTITWEVSRKPSLEVGEKVFNIWGWNLGDIAQSDKLFLQISVFCFWIFIFFSSF